MADLLKTDRVNDGYVELGDQTPHFRDNLTARVKTPFLADGTDLWDTWLDAREQNLHKKIKNQRPRFKIDHSFPLESLVGADINSDGSITIKSEIYRNSEGTEFIIIQDPNLPVAYAIHSDKYKEIRRSLSSGKFNEQYLKDAGAFKVNELLLPEEIPVHDGWLELNVRSNYASGEDYKEAARFLETQYIPEAQKNNCFRENGKGMGFFVRTDQEGCVVRPWFVGYSGSWSDASNWDGFSDDGRFLRVGAEGATREITPKNIVDYLKLNPITDESFARILLDEVNKFYQTK